MKMKHTLFLLATTLFLQSNCFANKDFNVVETNEIYINKKEPHIKLTYSGKEEFAGIWGGDKTKGGVMSLESTPTENTLVVLDGQPHTITYYSSPNSEEHKPENKIFTYEYKGN